MPTDGTHRITGIMTPVVRRDPTTELMKPAVATETVPLEQLTSEDNDNAPKIIEERPDNGEWNNKAEAADDSSTATIRIDGGDGTGRRVAAKRYEAGRGGELLNMNL